MSGEVDVATLGSGVQALADAKTDITQAAQNLATPSLSFNMGKYASAVCVKECPKKKTFANCLPNKDNTACDLASIDTFS